MRGLKGIGTSRLLLAACLGAVLLLAGLPPHLAPLALAQAQPSRGQIVEHQMRAPNSRPFGLAADSSGNIWFSQWATGIVGMIEPSTGRQLTYFIPTANAEPAGLAIDQAGDIWVAEHGAARIARLHAPSYTYDPYDLPTVGSEPYGIAIDPRGGTIWFTAFASNELGRLDPTTRQVRTFRVPTADSRPAGIAVGRDGMVYFAEWAGNRLGRFDPTTAEFTEWALPNPESYVYEITLDADGKVWYAEHGGESVGRLDPATGQFQRFTLPTQGANPYGLAFDPGGYLWFSEWTGNKIGRLDPATSTFQEFLVPTGDAQPGRVIVDASATVWFTQWAGNKIGQLATLQPVSWAPMLSGGADGRASSLQLQNVGTGPATVSVRYFDTSGGLLYTDPAVVLPVGGAATEYVPGKPFAAGYVGSATILSDGKIVAVVNETRDGASGYAAAAYDVPRKLNSTIVLPLVQRGRDGWATAFAIQNPGSTAARVTVRYITLQSGAAAATAPPAATPTAAAASPLSSLIPGAAATPTATATATATVAATPAITQTAATAIASVNELIPAGGTKIFDAGAAVPLDFLGSAVILSESPVAAVAWALRETAGATQFSGYTGVGDGSPTVSAPLLFRDYNGWNTDLYVQNMGDQPARVNITYVDQAAGAPIQAAAEAQTIAPGATALFRQAANGNLPGNWVGSALVASAGQPLAVVVNELNPKRGMAMGYNGLGLGDVTPRASVPLVMREYHGWSTGVQVQNLSDGPAVVTITYFDRDSGAPVGGAIETQTVPPSASYTFYQAASPGLPGGFVGSAVVTSGGRIAVVVNAVNAERPGDGGTSFNGANY